MLIIEDEYRAVWSPRSPFGVVVDTRKLIAAPTCWIRSYQPGVQSGKQIQELLEPHKSHEPLLDLPKKT